MARSVGLARCAALFGALSSLLFTVGPAAAQPMSGTVRIDSGGGADFSDLGSAFDALESRGIDGPTVLEVAEGTGPYVSGPSYLLAGVAGVTASNTITIVPATGEHPVIEGAGVQVLDGPSGTLAIGTSHTTVRGLDICGGAQFGLLLFRDSDPIEGITVDGNRVHAVSDGNGIWVSFDIPNVTITNNFVFDIRPGNVPIEGDVVGGIAVLAPGANTVIEHNTVVVDDPTGLAALIGEGGEAGVAIARLNYNLYVYGHRDAVPYTFNRAPSAANRNLFFARGTAEPFDLAEFRLATGLDADSATGDPRFTSAGGVAGDFGVAMDSPAVDAAVGSTSTVDANGTSRPQGAAPDIGAFELLQVVPPADAPRIGVTHVAESNVLDPGDIIDLDTVSESERTVVLEVSNTGDAPLSISDVEVVSSISDLAVTATPQTHTIAPTGAALIEVRLEPSGDQATRSFEVTVRIHSNDPDDPTYELTLIGELRPVAPTRGKSLEVSGEREIRSGRCETLTITSVGDEAVQISDVRVEGGTFFEIVGFSEPLTLQPGQSTTVDVCFDLNRFEETSSSATVIIDSDADRPVSVDVTGEIDPDSSACSLSPGRTSRAGGLWTSALLLALVLFRRRR